VLSAAPFIGFIPVRDLSTARTFYEETLGLEVTDVSPFAVAIRAGEAMVRLTRVDEFRPQPFTIAGWEVADMDTTIDALSARGVTFARYDGIGQDERGIWSTPGGDQVAWLTDPDGNTLSLTSFSR
jgi:predicted enzyme related to lactoylglutathione lyase